MSVALSYYVGYSSPRSQETGSGMTITMSSRSMIAHTNDWPGYIILFDLNATLLFRSRQGASVAAARSISIEFPNVGYHGDETSTTAQKRPRSALLKAAQACGYEGRVYKRLLRNTLRALRLSGCSEMWLHLSGCSETLVPLKSTACCAQDVPGTCWS